MPRNLVNLADGNNSDTLSCATCAIWSRLSFDNMPILLGKRAVKECSARTASNAGTDATRRDAVPRRDCLRSRHRVQFQIVPIIWKNTNKFELNCFYLNSTASGQWLHMHLILDVFPLLQLMGKIFSYNIRNFIF